MSEFIHILHNPDAVDAAERMKHIEDTMHLQDIPEMTTRFWTPVPANNVVTSINRSHKQIIQYLKDSQAEYGMIMEDDCQFPHPDGFAYFMRKWEEPENNYDIYFGGTIGERLPDNSVPAPIGMHCYVISRDFYDIFLSLRDDWHIDQLLEGKGHYGVCYPYAAIQKPAFSANLWKQVDYTVNYAKHDVYGWQ